MLDLGGKRLRWLDTPHVPHNWGRWPDLRGDDRRCSAATSSPRPAPPIPLPKATSSPPAIAVAERLPFMPPTSMAEPTLRRLAALKPTTIALMHGPTFKGDGAAALEGLADYYGK